MKKIRSVCALFLVCALLLSVVSCGYSPVKSSKEEREAVLTLDGNFDVPYELYRFYFLSELSLSGVDAATLSEEEKTALFAELHGKTVEELSAVYAVLKLCAQYDIDTESRAFDAYVKESITEVIDGVDGIGGYGDKDTYLAEIKKTYMNDSVFRFLLRYRYAEKALAAHLRDTGVLKSDKNTVLSYMNSDECVRASWIYIPYTFLDGYTSDTLDAKEAQAKAASNADFLKLTHEIPPTAYTDEELDIGFYMGRYQLDPYYATLTETVFSLDVGETSSWIDSGDGKYIVRRLPKDADYLADGKNLADFTEYYLLNSFYGLLAAESARIAQTASPTAFYDTLTLDSVKMPD